MAKADIDQARCDVASNDCCGVSALTKPVFNPSGAQPLHPPDGVKPAYFLRGCNKAP
jgi:hypothetical protein